MSDPTHPAFFFCCSILVRKVPSGSVNSWKNPPRAGSNARPRPGVSFPLFLAGTDCGSLGREIRFRHIASEAEISATKQVRGPTTVESGTQFKESLAVMVQGVRYWCPGRSSTNILKYLSLFLAVLGFFYVLREKMGCETMDLLPEWTRENILVYLKTWDLLNFMNRLLQN